MHLKRVFTFIKYFILCLALLFTIILIGVNLPVSQRFITKKANAIFLEKKLPVRVDKITLLINGKIGLNRPRIIMNSGDTVVFAGKIKVSVRIVPLLYKKVKVNSVTLHDAVVHITTDSVTGLPDIVSLFNTGNKSPKTKAKTGKKWDILVSTINLKNIRFTYNDVFHGIQIDQSVGKLYIRFNSFSLIRQQIYAAFIDLEKAHGELVLKQSSHTKKTENQAPSAWTFKLAQSDLKDILFTLHQPQKKQRMDFSLGSCGISDAGFDLAGSRVSAARLLLREPKVVVSSSPAPGKPEIGTKDASGIDFPGLLNITGNDLKIRNGSFQTGAYDGESGLPTEGSFQIAKCNVDLKDLRLKRMESGFSMSRLSFALGNGFQLEKGEITFRSDSTQMSQLTADLRTESSEIHLNVEARNELAAIINSIDSMPFLLNIDDTEISTRDVLAFLPHMKSQLTATGKNNLRVGIKCHAAGSLGLLNIENLTLNTESGASFTITGQVSHVKTPSSAVFSLAFRTGTITRPQLNELITLTGSTVNLPEFEPLTLQGRLGNRFVSPEFSLTMQSRSGNIAMNGSLDLPKKSYNLNMAWSGLELGKLAGIGDLDRLSGNLELAGAAFKPDKMKIQATLTIDSAGYRRYNYHDIHITLDGERGHYAFGVNTADTSFAISLTGTAEHNDTITKGQISGDFSVDAGRLNIFSGYTFRGELEAGMNQISGDLSGAVSLRNVVLSKDNNTEDLEDFSLFFDSTDSLVTGKIKTDFLRVDFQSNSSLGDLKKAFAKDSSRVFSLLDSAAGNIPYISDLPDLNVYVESTYDPFIGLLLNDSIFGFNKVVVKLEKDSTGISRADMSVDKFNFGMNSGFGTNMHFESFPDRSVLLVKADSMKYGKISLTDMAIDMTIAGDTALYRVKASDKNKRLLYDVAGAAYKSDRQFKLRSTQAQWILNGFGWTVSPGEFLVLEPEKKDFTADLHWKNGESTMDIYGRKSEKIHLDCRKVWLNMLVIPGMNIHGYDGEITGSIDYQGVDRNELGIHMQIQQMKLADRLLGTLTIDGSYVSDTLGTIESELRTVMNDSTMLTLMVQYEKNGSQTIRTDFSDIPLNLFEPVLKKYISGLHGDISGDLSLTSISSDPQLNGILEINNTALKIIPLNARFYLSDDVIELKNNQVLFKQFLVQDSLNKKLTVNGIIDLNDPRNITADLQVTSDRLQVMNTTEKDNPAFNGSVYVNSKLNITGQVQNPSLSGNIVLAEGTVVNYRYTENLSVSETEKTITFASLTQDQLNTGANIQQLTPLSTSPNIKASIEIDPNSLFNFQISRGYDIGVKITGGGFLNYALMPNKAMNLTGTYEIQQGSAELKIPGWPRKNFIITPGSYLKWNGPVDDPELRLETTTRVRGSYYNPVDGKNREVDFRVFMKLANRLSQLDILFDVGSNDQYITSVLSTLSTDERMRQAINLLIFERIELPNMASSSDYVTQQINQFWESQLNQFTKSAIKGVDLSIGIDTYKGASEGGGEQEYTSFTYEVKKEVFRDRGSVLVSGRMNDNSQAGAPTNNMFENFIFEYALDTNRSKYLKVYRQQNYEDLLEGEVTKSGVGFIYRKNYDRLKDIWRRKRKKKED